MATGTRRRASQGRSTRRLLRTSRLYAVLSHVGEAVFRVSERGQLYHAVCQIAVAQGGFPLAWIGLIDDVGGSVSPAAVAGPAAGYVSEIKVSVNDEPAGRGPTGTAIREARPVINNNLATSPSSGPWQGKASRFALRASAAFPLLVHGRPVGALNLYANSSDFFDTHEVALLERVAGALSFALEKLGDDEQRRRAEQALRLDSERQEALLCLGEMAASTEREIVNYALEEAVRLTRSGVGYLHFINDDQISLQLFTWSRGVRDQCYAEESTHYPLAEAGVWVDCVRLRRPIFHNDYQHLPGRKGYPAGHIHVERHLSVPLLDGEQVVAVAGVGNKAEPYEEADARQLLLFMAGMWSLLRRKRAEEALLAERMRLEARVAERTRELSQERDRTRAILEALGEAVMVFDRDGTLTYLNPAAMRATGAAPALGGHWWGTQPAASDQIFADLRGAAPPRRPWQGELILRRADGVAYEAAVTIAPLFAPADLTQTLGFVMVHRDITALKAAERMKDQFVSNVSHELRSPTSLITMLAGNLEMLYGRLEDVQRLEVIGEIRKHARSLSDLIGAVLEISQIDGGRIDGARQRLDLADLARQELGHLAPVARRKGLTVVADLPDTLPLVGHPGQLQQVLRNLLTNAIKYTPDGGRVTLSGCALADPAAADAARWPGVARLAPGPWAAVSVADTGIGIGPDDLPHIFERFYRAETQGEIPGTGLGLSIAAELVRCHSGHLEVCSAPGAGSTFVCYLPLAEVDR